MANIAIYFLALVVFSQSILVSSRQIDYDQIIFPTDVDHTILQVSIPSSSPSVPQSTSSIPESTSSLPESTAASVTEADSAEFSKCLENCQTDYKMNKLECTKFCGIKFDEFLSRYL